MNNLDKMRYPIGTFEYGKTYSLSQTRQNIKTIARFPKDLKKTIKKMSHSMLDKAYRPGGWTVRQVVHHLADSHMNAYIRMKLTMTEPTPIIKPYEEALWAETADGKLSSVKASIQLLSALHKRWVKFLESLSEEDLERGYFHPVHQGIVMLPEAIALYAWHCKHHLAHITSATQAPSKHDKVLQPVLKRRGRPQSTLKTLTKSPKAKSSLTRAEILDKARAARAANKTTQAPAAGKPKAVKKAAPAASDLPKLTRAEILEKARAARAANKTTQAPAAGKPKAVKKAAPAASDKPKLTRAEILEKARAARGANKTAQAPAAGKPKAVKKAAPAASDKPKLTRAEILEKARAARSANKTAQAPAAGKPKAVKKAAPAASDKPKLTRAEILEKARAARSANKTAQAPAAGKPKAKAVKKAAPAASDKPKLTRAEILEKARAARGAKKAVQAPAAVKAKAKAVKKEAPVASDMPKLSRAEILEKARAARATKKKG